MKHMKIITKETFFIHILWTLLFVESIHTKPMRNCQDLLGLTLGSYIQPCLEFVYMIMQGKDVRNGGVGGEGRVCRVELRFGQLTWHYNPSHVGTHTLSHGPNRLGTTMVVSHIESTNKSWKRLVHEKKANKHTTLFLLPNELVESEKPINPRRNHKPRDSSFSPLALSIKRCWVKESNPFHMEWEPINVCKWKWKYYNTWNQTQLLGCQNCSIFNHFSTKGWKKRMKPSHLIVTLLISRAFQRYQEHGEWAGRIIVREISIWQPNQTKQNKHTTFLSR
jgi:hypothetical protein